ncbi:MAG: DUF2470 domain-containing protein [Pseudomonadota bacterium]
MTDEPGDGVRHAADAETIQAAKALARTARSATLATAQAGTGWPLASRVNLATDIDGAPVLLISQLSDHFRALETEPRCSLLIGEARGGDPLTHPRLTAFGKGHRIADREQRSRLRTRFLRKHPASELYIDFEDFAFWRVELTEVSLVLGFARAYTFAGDALMSPTTALTAELEADAVAHMNEDHVDAIGNYAEQLGYTDEGWSLAGLDTEGADLIRGDEVARFWFDDALKDADALRPTLIRMIKRS